MHPGEIVEVLRQRPFEPFRLYLSDGASYDIPDPDLCLVTMTNVIIGIPVPRDPRHPAAATVRCAPEHVTRIEVIEQAAGTKAQ